MGKRGKVLRRLDHLIKSLINHIVSCCHTPVQSFISDQCLVQMSLNIDEVDCGLGR